jgi:hypothetical protein
MKLKRKNIQSQKNNWKHKIAIKIMIIKFENKNERVNAFRLKG